MRKLNVPLRSMALATMLALVATPALAGKEDRAKRAIAEAQGKIDAAEKAGTTGEAPGLVADANAALRAAREDLASDHNTAAIQAAIRASALADRAIGVANRNRAEAEAAARADAAARTAAAQEQASAAAAAAQDANARAAAAEQSAALANAQAEALRNAPPPAAAVVTTTETTRTASAARPATTKKVVRRTVPARPATRSATTEKTTTTTIQTGVAAPATGY